MPLSNALIHCLLVALGGGMGALTRYGVENLPWFDDNKYYYTIIINITGCLLIGTLYATFQHLGAPRWVYLLCLTGFLGGYTTYSAFTLDAMQRIQEGRIDMFFIYVTITVIGGLSACALGLFGTMKLLKMI